MAECICGCGRLAGAGQRGLAHACYTKLYRAGGVALLDRYYPRRPNTGRPRRMPLVDLLRALEALKAARRG